MWPLGFSRFELLVLQEYVNVTERIHLAITGAEGGQREGGSRDVVLHFAGWVVSLCAGSFG